MRAQQMPLRLQADGRFSFDRFVSTDNEALLNQLEKLSRFASSRAEQLYLYGPASSGKTHLLQAACREASRQGRGSAYIPLSVFNQQGAGSLAGLDDTPFIAVDDCDAVLSDGTWQEQLFHLINGARARRHSLVMAGRENPVLMQLSLRDLQSRLVWGGVYAVQRLPDADKITVLTRVAAEAGYRLSGDAAHYILNTYPRDLSSLVVLVQRLVDSGQPRNHAITIPLVKRVLENS